MRDEKEGRKKQARSNKQQGKATQHTQGSHLYIHVEKVGDCEDIHVCIYSLWLPAFVPQKVYMYITCILTLELLLCASSKVKGQKSTRGGESRNEGKVQQLFVPSELPWTLIALCMYFI